MSPFYHQLKAAVRARYGNSFTRVQIRTETAVRNARNFTEYGASQQSL